MLVSMRGADHKNNHVFFLLLYEDGNYPATVVVEQGFASSNQFIAKYKLN